MQRKREFRRWKTEIRTEVVDGKSRIVGYGAVFNQLSEPMRIGNRTVRERVMPGAFDKCFASNPDIRGLINHDPNMILGRTKSGTMRVSIDSVGAKYEIDPPNTSYASDLMESLNRGDIDQSSFGFYTIEDGYVPGDDGQYIRELREIDCFDMSPVTFPAYSGSTSGVRAQEELRTMFPDGIPESLEGDMPPIKVGNLIIELREVKTKKVDGKDLHASDFAHVGDPQDTSTWKLPIHDASHVRNALARFNQVEGLSKAEKDAAWKKIVTAAKKFDIKVSEENAAKLFGASYREAKAMLREIDPDGDGDDDTALIEALCDAHCGCQSVCATVGGALSSFWDGEPEYSDPLLEAFVKQAQALIADLNKAIAEASKELSEEPVTAELNSRRERYRKLFVKK